MSNFEKAKFVLMEKTAEQTKLLKNTSTSLVALKNYINGELIEPIGKGYIDN